MSGSAADKLKHPRLSQAIYCDTLEQVCKLLSGFGPFYWLLGLVLFVGLRLFRIVLRLVGLPQHAAALAPHARLMAKCILAFAAASTVAWLANPVYTVTFSGVAGNDNLFLGTVMLVVGVLLLATTALPRPHDPGGGRRSLQFSIRTLLMLTTVCALALGAAPFGYMAAIYLGGATILYLFARRILKSAETILQRGQIG